MMYSCKDLARSRILDHDDHMWKNQEEDVRTLIVFFQSRIVSSTRVWKGDDRLGFSDIQCLVAHLLVQVALGIWRCRSHGRGLSFWSENIQRLWNIYGIAQSISGIQSSVE